MKFTPTDLAGRGDDRAREARRRARLLRPHLLRRGVRPGRARDRLPAVEPLAQPAEGDAPRHALPAPPARRGEAGARGAGRHPRRHRRHPPREPELRPLAGLRSRRGSRAACSTCPRASRTASRPSRTTPTSPTMVSHPYTPGAEGGLRWDDPLFAIRWPLPVAAISEKDAAWPHVDRAGAGRRCSAERCRRGGAPPRPAPAPPRRRR